MQTTKRPHPMRGAASLRNKQTKERTPSIRRASRDAAAGRAGHAPTTKPYTVSE